ncbi:CMD domain protein [Paracoccus denitrificans]|jgi:CMD domain protein|uniref:CMD domain protein n=1 Tax=Paracoccus denitrificans (strain Pd 1222) TaxID=318586 RepID=A1BBR6_PARDP|nr:CMD domain protein [Paracoccus denitrificans]ABL72960.1 conserved hypothetical protein [Paracoccus denitrificans PD1222]MBB4626437.1 CMD domain protein [Paracoccus denitrificans]MCU7427359.1 CMD domain protein [Paracoccus denitrificans]QAR29360.1 CMD domain protein [Paracoccus denitrificans]UPV98311.1 CMD domain protein [Paracoccus denitrificans]
MSDTINRLAGIAPGSHLDQLRNRRAQAKTSAEESFTLLLSPADEGDFPVADRRRVAFFVALLHGDAEAVSFYEALLGEDPLAGGLRNEAERAVAPGPWGRYPVGPLSAEDIQGPALAIPDAAGFEPKLARALEHAHLLVLHPRDASPRALQALLDAGWSTTGVVTLSQLVAFLSFQIRAAIGLRALSRV